VDLPLEQTVLRREQIIMAFTFPRTGPGRRLGRRGQVRVRRTPTTTLSIGGTVAELIGAITVADRIPGPVVIELAPNATYHLTAVDNNWYGPNGLPPITNDVTIDGRGAAIRRDATATDFRLFYVSGGLSGELPAGSLTLKNLTLEGGLARGGDGGPGGGGGSGLGGALFNLDGYASLADDTLDANTVAAGSGATLAGTPSAAADGSEVYHLAFGNNIPDGGPTAARLDLTNSILADGAGGPDLASRVLYGLHLNTSAILGGTNLVESVDIDPNTNLGAGVITAAGSPHLGPLQDNGGLTATMALSVSSLEFGAGDPKAPLLSATDQRGLPRVVFGRLDLGAYENQTVVLPPSVLDFVTQAVVTPNPHAPPPSALVLFMPEPTFIPPGPQQTPFHIQGELTVSIQGGWSLDAVYTLDGQVSREEAPGSAGSDSITASYSYEAHVTETLIPPGPQTHPVWLYDTTESSHGEYTADFRPLSKTETAVDASFQDTTDIEQSIRKEGSTQPSWKFDGTVVSQGTLGGSQTYHQQTDPRRPQVVRHYVEAQDCRHLDANRLGGQARPGLAGRPGRHQRRFGGGPRPDEKTRAGGHAPRHRPLRHPRGGDPRAAADPRPARTAAGNVPGTPPRG
jgi:hypothetical protein